MALLARRFEPLAEETALRSTFDFLNFQRRVGEKTDELLTRFDVLVFRARQRAGFDMTIPGVFFILFSA
eukprot:6266646-Lingulodinium_polyedra.AAC.1